jgi:NAD-dependent protein deacetylase/lipoamidase
MIQAFNDRVREDMPERSLPERSLPGGSLPGGSLPGGSLPGRSPSSTLDRLAELMRGARSVVALTGAGVSVPSGIPDFRTPGTGMWEKVDPMEVAHIDAFRRDPVRFWSFYGQRFATLGGKLPNGAHDALVAMERHGLLDAVITQNIDMLHRKAGTRELTEMHGSIASCSCLSCSTHVPLEEVRARLRRAADGVPRCEDCERPLKPDVVLFGEMLRADTLERARATSSPSSRL